MNSEACCTRTEKHAVRPTENRYILCTFHCDPPTDVAAPRLACSHDQVIKRHATPCCATPGFEPWGSEMRSKRTGCLQRQWFCFFLESEHHTHHAVTHRGPHDAHDAGLQGHLCSPLLRTWHEESRESSGDRLCQIVGVVRGARRMLFGFSLNVQLHATSQSTLRSLGGGRPAVSGQSL